MNNRDIVFAPLPPGCTHISRSPTSIHAINQNLNQAPYRWDPTRPTNGYTGSWIHAFPRTHPPTPQELEIFRLEFARNGHRGMEYIPPRAYPRVLFQRVLIPGGYVTLPVATPLPYVGDAVPAAGFAREDWLHPPPPQYRIRPVIARDRNQPPVRAIPIGDGEAVPPGHGRFSLHGDGSYRLQEVTPAKEEEEVWEEWEADGVDWEQVVRWNELAAIGRANRRNPASLTSEEERRLPPPERALSERSWPESEVTDPELVERAEQRRVEQGVERNGSL